MGFISIAKGSRLRSSRAQAVFLRAGWRSARPESRPLGRPGDLPQGFGASAGVPTAVRSVAKLRRRPGTA